MTFRTTIKADMLAWLERRAERGEECPSNQEIADRFDMSGTGRATSLLQALERDGAIAVDRFQAARRVTIVRSGAQTYVAPAAMKPHWRERPERAADAVSGAERAPYPPPKQIQREEPKMALAIAIEADRRGQSMATFLSELVAIGWKHHIQEKRSKAA